MTEHNLSEDTVREVAEQELKILGRYVPEIDARLASELLRLTGKHFIVTTYLREGQVVIRAIATRCQWSRLIYVVNNSWVKREVAAAMAAPETKGPDAPQEEHAGSSQSTGRKKRRR